MLGPGKKGWLMPAMLITVQWGPMSFSSVATSSRIDKKDDNLLKPIPFLPFLRLTL